VRLAQETEDLPLEQAAIRAGVAALLADPAKGRYFVAEVAGTVVGQVMITYEWSDWRNGNIWWLQSVYVEPSFRRQGVFRALFAHVQTLAQQFEEVWGLRLYMHAGNGRARSTYEKLGMTRTPYEVLELELPAH
jgi:GNAT superfamily N-acetyltransferase